MYCIHCGTENPDNAKFCNHCGIPLDATKTIKLRCERCGATMESDKDNVSIYCPHCGSKELVVESEEVKISKIKLAQTKADKELKEVELQREKEDNEVFKWAFPLILICIFGMTFLFLYIAH